ncbi:MAG: hypothetical protein JRE64_21675 [Deltaproteobacteria bacterium]|nr:hypothetical protein [Deltaproteobacteria bacterium]
MNLSAYEIALIAGIFTIIGTLLGAWITYRNALEIQKIAEFNKAAGIFKATFVDEIFRVRRNIEKPGERYLERHEDIVIANEKAKIIFEAFLPTNIRNSFNGAWNKYKNCEGKENKPYSPLNPEHRKEIVNIELSHINNLLEFAKPKM